MAIRTAIEDSSIQTSPPYLVKATWSGLLNGDSGASISWAALSDKTVQLLGTFGAGGTVVIEGSNDGGTTYATLSDEQGTALSFTAAGLKLVLQNPEKIRPRVTAGDGNTNLTAIICATSSQIRK